MSGDVTAGVLETTDDHLLDVVHSENLADGSSIESSTQVVQTPIEASVVAPAISSKPSTVDLYSRESDITVQPKNSNISLQPQSIFWLPSCTKNSNFCRNAQWCADGGSILSVLEDASIEVIDVTEDMASESRLSIKHAAPVLSTVWYPSATPTQPASYCFVAAVRDGPVKLLDASDGRRRASYKIIDHRERFIAPHSMAFNMYMNKLYCGFEDAIEVFDVHHPGGESTRLHTVPTKKSRDGLRGIVSALAFAPDWSGLYVAGSYSGAIAMYTEDTGAQAQGWLEGVEGGVTQIRFNPTQPNLVHAAFRRTPTIATWDLRKPVEPISLYDRGVVETNQRLHFDVSPDGQWLIAGDERGVISLFDTQSSGNLDNAAPRVKLEAHKDSIGAVSFHPTKPVVLSVCGSRHFEELDSDSDSSIEDSSDMEHVEIMVSGTWQSTQRGVAKIGSQPPITMDNSMKLWSYEST